MPQKEMSIVQVYRKMVEKSRIVALIGYIMRDIIYLSNPFIAKFGRKYYGRY